MRLVLFYDVAAFPVDLITNTTTSNLDNGVKTGNSTCETAVLFEELHQLELVKLKVEMERLEAERKYYQRKEALENEQYVLQKRLLQCQMKSCEGR